MTVVTSYANTGGTGNRAGVVTVTTTATAGGGAVSAVIDGVTASGSYWWNNAQTKRTITFDFGTAQVFDEVKWYQSSASSQGLWVVLGSNDLTNWNLLTTAAVTLGSAATQTITLTGNPEAYRYLRLAQVNGTTNSTPFIREAEFKLVGTGGTVGTDDATTPDYGNPGGMFDRTGVVTVTSAITPSVGTGAALVNGSRASGEFLLTNPTSGHALTFDFGSGASKRITEVTVYHESASANHGSWKWQGSNDGSAFTDLGSAFTLGGALTQTDTTLAANATGYRYYRLTQTSGTTSNFYLQEFDFKIANSSGAIGTLSAIEGADSSAASGLVTVTGTLAATDGADSSAASGAETATGTIAATDGADTASVSGTSRTTGTLAATDGADAAAFFGAAAISTTGTLAATEGADSAALSGANVASGTLAAGEGADTASATGAVRSTGTIAATDGADLAAVVGQTATSGVLAAVEGADAAAIVGGHTLPDWITIELSGTFTPTRGLIGTFIPARTLVGRFAPVKALAGTLTAAHELDGTFTPARTLIGRTH